jgi:hypothetical protein
LEITKYFSADEEDSEVCEKVLAELETVDQEIDNLDITFVKIADPKYARKWGVTTLPSLVYFRKRFPSIYRGQCLTLKYAHRHTQKNTLKIFDHINTIIFQVNSPRRPRSWTG